MPIIADKADRDNTLIYTEHYPIYNKNRKRYRHDILLGIGGNVGDVIRRFEHLYYFLVKSPFISIIETSPILRNPPFGYLDQDDFYNAVIDIQSHMSPHRLLNYILGVEKHFRRRRSFANAPRTLDIDMIFYDDRQIDTPRLTVPHPCWQERKSVLIPLSKMKGKRWSKRLL